MDAVVERRDAAVYPEQGPRKPGLKRSSNPGMAGAARVYDSPHLCIRIQAREPCA